MNYYLIDASSVKAASLVNYNCDDETLGYAIREAQDVYLKEILGNALLEKCVELASGDTLDNEGNEAYKDLIDKYIYDFLVAKSQEQILIPISFKIRNIGVSQDSDTNVASQQFQNIIDLKNYWRTVSIDRGNRLKCFLNENKSAFPELDDCACGGSCGSPNLQLETNCNLNI